ncbi:schwannomin-interacting protein 1 homolog isoform X3 [Danaus plexippus]|uniref:schwannomin-interacting protein 1 homolog isoform X3 n=1 Tax=Danaus plexippus TaxID=13037 RepID=UPI002AAFFD59|nr:schwannomin-interacting protein 1 homolog isoform X3 [Danaus plexippus]
MRITDSSDNGNLPCDNVNSGSHNIAGGHWTETTTEDYKHTDINNTNSFVSNNIIDNINYNTDNIHEIKKPNICHRECNLNNNENSTDSLNITNLEKDRQTQTKRRNNALAETYNIPKTQVLGERRYIEHSDSDEMSENRVHPVPRGIVNPNYPGFQHLAHTLQDYSSNIEQFYPSDNEMTDDDLDADITPEATIDVTEKIDDKIIINNNNKNNSSVSKNPFINETTQPCKTQSDIPDLLKTVTLNNNNDSAQYELSNCSATDIENNFRAKDIIGDFNKEVEDEIRQLLNYNINIEDDLEELRRDIKDKFAKPIENTLNNISDVVNHVIKKLVENEDCDRSDTSTPDIIIDHEMEDVTNVSRENETNTRAELSINRPTFLLIDNKDVPICDALLSDGKEEININVDEYDTEHLTHNVENTIKQLSTELRKIIPKLNEMRERDKLWGDRKKDVPITDGNSNTLMQSSSAITYDTNSCSQNRNGNNRGKATNFSNTNQRSIRAHIDPRLRQNAKKSQPKLPMNLSVRQSDNHDDSDLESFDVYNIETALPKLDLDAIESHIKAAKEAERRKRNDREEIRKRLAMGADTEEYYSLGHTDRPGKKPSLHSRLQNGKNLQICFMNETASDNESQASDLEHNLNCNSNSSSRSSLFSKNSYNHPYQTRPLSVNITKHEKNPPTGAKLRPTSLMFKSKSRSTQSLGHIELKESDFYALQATLQTEARIALAQAKEMARIQMERERRSRPVSPVTEMLRRSMEKANAPLAADRRRVSRHLLTDMNIAQLQVIVNELHSQIESLNDALVKFLMARDELHMGQDSMLVDIEDLTRYLYMKFEYFGNMN